MILMKDIQYEREVSHCSVSKYVKDVTISEVLPAENSDNLERILFKEIGWNAIAKKGIYKPNDMVFFIPPESVLPLELSEALNITNYLSKGRVKIIKLRGNRSEGLIVNKEITSPYLPYILQWEDLPTIKMSGDQLPNSEIPVIEFQVFFKMPNILNEPKTFTNGEEVYISEKIHGTNCRFGILKHPITNEPTLYVGSHNCTLKESDDNLYWKAVKQNIDLKTLPSGIVFYGEVYGRGIQDLHYESNIALRIFASCKENSLDYMSVEETIKLCDEFKIPRVEFHKKVYENIEWARDIANTPSEYTDKHIREGIVLREASGPIKFAKVISENYLLRKGTKTERH